MQCNRNMIFYEDYYITFHINKYVVVYIEIANIPLLKKKMYILCIDFFIYMSLWHMILITKTPYHYSSCVRIDSQYKHMYPPVCRMRRQKVTTLRMRPQKPRPRVTAGVAR